MTPARGGNLNPSQACQLLPRWPPSLFWDCPLTFLERRAQVGLAGQSQAPTEADWPPGAQPLPRRACHLWSWGRLCLRGPRIAWLAAPWLCQDRHLGLAPAGQSWPLQLGQPHPLVSSSAHQQDRGAGLPAPSRSSVWEEPGEPPAPRCPGARPGLPSGTVGDP